jgi:hypothetical protein
MFYEIIRTQQYGNLYPQRRIALAGEIDENSAYQVIA